jgi:hypothetical protein
VVVKIPDHLAGCCGLKPALRYARAGAAAGEHVEKVRDRQHDQHFQHDGAGLSRFYESAGAGRLGFVGPWGASHQGNGGGLGDPALPWGRWVVGDQRANAGAGWGSLAEQSVVCGERVSGETRHLWRGCPALGPNEIREAADADWW